MDPIDVLTADAGDTEGGDAGYTIAGASDPAASGGSPDWLDRVLGGVGTVAEAAGKAYGSYVSAQQAANERAAQTRYMSQLAQTSASQSAVTQRNVLYLGAALVMFMFLLRQTAQAR